MSWSSVVGGVLGLIGGERTNASNAKTAAAQMAFEDAQSNENRAFQERMSGTAHTREVNDLRMAGLNPILSGTGGMGSSTPSGSTAKSSGYASVDSVGAGLSSAMAVRRNEAEIENIETVTRTADSQRRLNESLDRRAFAEELNINQLTKNERTRGLILGDQRHGTRIEGEIDQSRYGTGMRYIGRALESINSAGSASRLFRQR